MAQSNWGVGLLACAFVVTACAASDETEQPGSNYSGSPTNSDEGDGGGDGGGEGSGDTGEDGADLQGVTLSTGCNPYGSDVYTPFVNYGPVSSGKVTSYPWNGPAKYPETIEDFRAYGPTLPAVVECGADKSQRSHLDVTSGCLDAVSSGGDKVGRIRGTSDGYYRSFALAYDANQQRQVAWTDMGVEYRFNYAQWTGNVSGPGFKAFARYMTEYDLYVASWRMDGTVQIQKKQCGVYTVLKRDANYGAPSPNVWHTMRFEVVGNEQRLYLDGRLAMTSTDDSIKRGTAGIRIDSAEGALIDDWRVYAP
jgi:hypothetical protein